MTKEEIKRKLLKNCTYSLVDELNESLRDFDSKVMGYVDHKNKIVWVRKNPKWYIGALAHEVMHIRGKEKGRNPGEISSYVYQLHILWKYKLIEDLKIIMEDLQQSAHCGYTYPKIREEIKQIVKSNLWKRCKRLVEEIGAVTHP